MFVENLKYTDILSPISSKIQEKKIISFDIETYDNNKYFLLGDIYDGIDHKTFYNREEMAKYFIDNPIPNAYIVSTNLAFDFTMLYGTKDLHKFDIIQSNGRFISCKYKFSTTGNTNVFIDSLNFANMSVESAGKLLGLQKIEHPSFLGKMPKDKEQWQEMILYNQRDTEITYKLMRLLQSGFNELGGNLKLTISSTALDIFKRKYLKQKLTKESAILGTNKILDRIYDSYYGGRTECFARGLIGKGYSSKKTVATFDINSLYPSVMCREYPLPQSIKEVKEPKINHIRDYEGISNVIIECDYMEKPLLPYRDKVLNKLIFPVGRWKATYTHTELQKALELGYRITKINWQYIYTQAFEPFVDFIQSIYDKRLEYKKIDNPLEYVMKITMNSTYGKFGSRKLSELEFFNLDDMKPDEILRYFTSPNTESFNEIGYYIHERKCDSSYVFPIIASYTTAYARMKLYEYLSKYNVYYCDTDSIITDDEIDTGKNLGEMKKEYEIKKGVIIKPKMYQFHLDNKTITKMKGIPRPNPEYFTKALNKMPIEYQKFMKLKESIRQRTYVNMITYIKKDVKLEDNKRVWVKPFNFLEFDNDSKPHFINDTTTKYKKIIQRLSYRDKVMKNKDSNYDIVKQFLSKIRRQ